MAMLARVAEQLYWMARYLERAENTARLINVTSSYMLDLPRAARPGWFSLIAITGSSELFWRNYHLGDEDSVSRFLIGDTRNPSSIVSSLGYARENARTLREVLPRSAWEQLNEIYLYAQNNLDSGLAPKKRFDYLHQIMLAMQQITGLLDGTMSHDAGFDFLRMGQHLERADMTTRIIDVQCANLARISEAELRPYENILWMSVLKSLTAYQMYRRNMQVAVNGSDVLYFLLRNDRFPRSFAYCLRMVRTRLGRLPNADTALASLKELDDLVADADAAVLSEAILHQYLDDLQLALGNLHQAIYQCYFSVDRFEQALLTRAGVQSRTMTSKQIGLDG